MEDREILIGCMGAAWLITQYIFDALNRFREEEERNG